MASKPHTGLRTRPSAAKCLEEPDFDVQNSPDPPKSDENHENQKKIQFFFSKNFFGVKKGAGPAPDTQGGQQTRAAPTEHLSGIAGQEAGSSTGPIVAANRF